jgi:hypothetical protein
MTKAKVYKGTGQEECERVWAWKLTLPNELPFWELESRWTPEPSKSNCKGQNILHWGVLHIIGNLLNCRCLKWVHMTHLDICNINYGKKKGRKSKLAIWLPTTKSRELTRLPCVQVTCKTPLESSRQELQLYVKPHPDQRSEHEVIALQSCRSSNPSSFKTPLRKSRDKNPFGCRPRGEVQIILYGGRWWLPSNSNCGESCESEVACGLSWHQRCSNIVLTNLWLVGCRFMWVNKLFATLPNSIPELQHAPLPLQVLRTRERALSS